MATAVRSAEDTVYRPGKVIRINVQVVPHASALVYALEETPPAGWAVTAWDQGGAFFGGIIRWGPFFDNIARAFNYQVVPPMGSEKDGSFSGVASFDGVSITIGGTQNLKIDSIAPKSPK